ncbi:hypothetical protein NEPAR04_1213 [Nematocida parisii]|nr:hypothetical protein NEPAR03_0104 [Nematocida parisii]KAI5125553.1 hypothetical protein NEPAR08_0104 [Nematocida parisii]KAI5141826.1 hypothetical protein NEPAR04_1213 [Nematocida parisii]
MNQATLHGQEAMNEGAGQTCTITIEQETAQTSQELSHNQIDSAPEERSALVDSVKKLTEEELEAYREKRRKKNKKNAMCLQLIKTLICFGFLCIFMCSIYALAEHKTN